MRASVTVSLSLLAAACIIATAVYATRPETAARIVRRDIAAANVSERAHVGDHTSVRHTSSPWIHEDTTLIAP